MSLPNPYCGVVVPMISPFTPEGAIDEPAVGRIVELLIKGGVKGIFPLGTTGESASVAAADKRTLIAATVDAVDKRVMVYGGIAGNCFKEALDAAKNYKLLGVDAVVAHMPSYYPLSDAEIEAYFLKLADAVPLPLLMYNIPPTTHHHIALDVVERLMKHPNVVAIKDSSGDPQRLTDLLKLTGGRDGYPVLLGASVAYAHGLKLGAVGLIPSGGHLIPELYNQMYLAAMEQNWDEVDRLQKETEGVTGQYLKGKSIGQGLAALKVILEQRGICGRTMLPPLQTIQ